MNIKNKFWETYEKILKYVPRSCEDVAMLIEGPRAYVQATDDLTEVARLLEEASVTIDSTIARLDEFNQKQERRVEERIDVLVAPYLTRTARTLEDLDYGPEN